MSNKLDGALGRLGACVGVICDANVKTRAQTKTFRQK